jgi:hypothetical protein
MGHGITASTFLAALGVPEALARDRVRGVATGLATSLT